ncbi:ABC transporter permease [Leifsonia bigeumensis]|uniref:ABC transporter permease n=1 Tax=Leifsonella bigeumensis TaxID=433643 RepID=A0ABP7FLK8_9MICO
MITNENPDTAAILTEQGPKNLSATDAEILARAPIPGLRQRILKSRWLTIVSTPLLIIIFLVAWKLYTEWSGVTRFVLPAPEAVGAAFLDQITDPHTWTQHIWTTFYEVVAGLFWAIIVGVGLGFAIGKSPVFERVSRPFVVATQVVPKVALVPLFLLWLGFGAESKILIAALLAFFPLLINTALGVRSVPRSMHDLMTSLKANRLQRFWKVEVPHTMAYILAGLEVAVVQATVGAIVGEYLGGDKGLGRWAVDLQNALQIDKLYGSILIMTLFGFVLYSVVAGSRRLLIPWHESVQKR